VGKELCAKTRMYMHHVTYRTCALWHVGVMTHVWMNASLRATLYPLQHTATHRNTLSKGAHNMSHVTLVWASCVGRVWQCPFQSCYIAVMLHSSHFTFQSCYTYEFESCCTYAFESCYTCARMSHVAHESELRRLYVAMLIWVMSHVWKWIMSHMWMKESCRTWKRDAQTTRVNE